VGRSPGATACPVTRIGPLRFFEELRDRAAVRKGGVCPASLSNLTKMMAETYDQAGMFDKGRNRSTEQSGDQARKVSEAGRPGLDGDLVPRPSLVAGTVRPKLCLVWGSGWMQKRELNDALKAYSPIRQQTPSYAFEEAAVQDHARSGAGQAGQIHRGRTLPARRLPGTEGE